MDKKWIYYGVFFSDVTKRALLDYTAKLSVEKGFTIPEDWKIYGDHMTLVFNDKSEKAQEDAEFYEEQLVGKDVSLRVTHVGVSDRAVALGVDYQTANEHSHITIAIAPDAKPVESNDITNWMTTGGGFYVTGKVNKFVKH